MIIGQIVQLLHIAIGQIIQYVLDRVQSVQWIFNTWSNKYWSIQYSMDNVSKIYKIYKQRRFDTLSNDYWKHCPMIIGQLVQWLLDKLFNIHRTESKVISLLHWQSVQGIENWTTKVMSTEKWTVSLLGVKVSCSYQPYYYNDTAAWKLRHFCCDLKKNIHALLYKSAVKKLRYWTQKNLDPWVTENSTS